jgi:hypothetical protein
MSHTMPSILLEIAEVIGEPAALQLAEQHQGERVYIPEHPGPEHELCRLIGAENAARLARVWSGQSIELPMLRARTIHLRNELIREDARHMSHAQLVRKWRLCRRQIINILNQQKRCGQAPQHDLFEENTSENHD